MSHFKLKGLITKFLERGAKGEERHIKYLKATGQDTWQSETVVLMPDDVIALEVRFAPKVRGSVIRFCSRSRWNPIDMLCAITGRKKSFFGPLDIYCDGYLRSPRVKGESDIFARLSGKSEVCSKTGNPLELDSFTGEPLVSGVSITAPGGIQTNFPLDLTPFESSLLNAVEFWKMEDAAD